MKNRFKCLNIAIVSVIALTGCQQTLSEEKASHNLLKSIPKSNSGMVLNSIDSETHQFEVIINEAHVDFYKSKIAANTEITLTGNISIDDTIFNENEVKMTFNAESYFNKSKAYIGMKNPRLIKLDVSNVYSAYYAAFERSLSHNIQEEVGLSISQSSLTPSYVDDNKDFSIEVESNNKNLILRVND